MGIKVISGLEVASDNEGVIELELTNHIDFSSSETLEIHLQKFVYQILEGDMANIDGTLGGGIITFGSDQKPENVIDTFSQVAINLKMKEYAPNIKNMTASLIDDFMNLNVSLPYPTIKKAEIDVHDETTLIANIGAHINNLTGDFYMNIPYFQTGLLWDGNNFCFIRASKILYQDGQFSTTALVSFPENHIAAQELVTMLGNMVFHRKQDITTQISGKFFALIISYQFGFWCF